jgi:ribosomal protein S18 acetylase RimI-like enzyme
MITIRKGIATDVPAALILIKELAAFENAEGHVLVNEAYMLKEGFSNQPSFWFYVAEENGTVLGMALCYYRYSTWKGRRIYLEDIIVNEKHRSKGIGKLLFERVIEQAKAEQLSGVVWQVLEWNKDAIRFYEKFDSRFDYEWVNCFIDTSK